MNICVYAFFLTLRVGSSYSPPSFKSVMFVFDFCICHRLFGKQFFALHSARQNPNQIICSNHTHFNAFLSPMYICFSSVNCHTFLYSYLHITFFNALLPQ